MIYMVDHVYTDPSSEEAWHTWYAEYLRKLVSVPGIHSAQRFRAVGSTPSQYLAMYSIDSEAVYSSAAYRRIGGGGSQSARFHYAYALWTRNLFDGAARAPLVAPDERLIVWDSAEQRDGMCGGLPVVWLKAVGLHMSTPYRAYAVLDGETGLDAKEEIPSARVYELFTPPLLARHGEGSRSDRIGSR